MKKAKAYLSLLILTGFFISAQTGTTIVDSIYSNGLYRTYRLYKPLSYSGSQAFPLVLNLHGYTSNALQQQNYGNFMPIADTANFLIVHPQGTKDPTNQPYWNAGITSTGANDLLFITQLIDSLKSMYTIDANSIYSTGLSNGSFMSNYLACNLSSTIAAIAGVAGTMFSTWYNTCNPGRPVPVMHIHGNADGTVAYNGGSGYISVDTLIKIWSLKNNCNPVPTFSAVPNINVADGCTADHFLYSGGNLGSTIELYRVNGGGHTWPGSTFSVGVTNQDFNASVEIWRFFRKYKLNLLTGVGELNSGSEVTVGPNPFVNTITVGSDNSFVVTLYDLTGKLLGRYKDEKTIDLSSLQNGMYFLNILSEGKTFTKKIVKQ